MPRVRTLKSMKTPEGFDEIEAELDEFEKRMAAAVAEPHEGKRKCESIWPIHKINWERSRFVFDKFKSGEISRPLYDWLLKERYADHMLIAKWKKPGYEYLCSLSAIDTKSTNFRTTSICRVPLHLRSGGPCTPAVATGCISCASVEASRFGGPIWYDSPRPADLVAWAKAGCPTTARQEKLKGRTEEGEVQEGGGVKRPRQRLPKGAESDGEESEDEATRARAARLRMEMVKEGKIG